MSSPASSKKVRRRLVDRTGDSQCIVCGRAAGSYALWPRGEIPGFTCSIECAYLAQWVRELSVKELSELERDALDKAGALAGGYLDELGKTDLATLTREEWNEFLTRVVTGFSSGLKDVVEEDSRIAPPY